MTTYSELVTQIRDYTETSSDVLTDTIVNDFIEHTENDLVRQLDIPAFRSYQYTQFTSSNPFLIVPGGTVPTPAEFSVIRSVNILENLTSTSATGNGGGGLVFVGPTTVSA